MDFYRAAPIAHPLISVPRRFSNRGGALRGTGFCREGASACSCVTEGKLSSPTDAVRQKQPSSYLFLNHVSACLNSIFFQMSLWRIFGPTRLLAENVKVKTRTRLKYVDGGGATYLEYRSIIFFGTLMPLLYRDSG